MGKKPFLLLAFLLFLIVLYSCGGGGGNQNGKPIYIDNGSISIIIGNRTISETNPPNSIAFKFGVTTKAPVFNVALYLSRDDNLSSDDYEFYSSQISNSKGQFVIRLDNKSAGFTNLINYYGGKYYVIAKVVSGTYSDWASSPNIITLKKKWTFAVYMDADNSLNDTDIDNMNQMENVGSSKDVNVVVEDDGKHSPTVRYFIEKGKRIKLKNLGELDMAEEKTLVDFAKWLKDDYPADRYFIVIWDHGLGFESIGSYSVKDLLVDETNNTIMSVPTFGKALDNVSAVLGKKISIVGIDACLMNMVEVAYEIRNSSSLFVASENLEPLNGWPYESILSYIVGNPDASSKQIASKVVYFYKNYYEGLSYPKPTLSAIDLSKINGLVYSIDNLSENLLKDWDNSSVSNAIKSDIFNAVQRFKVSDDDYSFVDLGNLATLIYGNDNMTSDIKQAAKGVLDNLSETVIANGYDGFDNGSVTGLTIWFPGKTVYDSQVTHYKALEFDNATDWSQLLFDLNYN